MAGSGYATWSFFRKIAHVLTKQAATAAKSSSSGFADAAGSSGLREPAIGIVRPAAGRRITPAPAPSPFQFAAAKQICPGSGSFAVPVEAVGAAPSA